jgi:hypothetical protein
MGLGVADQGCDIVGLKERIREDLGAAKPGACSDVISVTSAVETYGSSAMERAERAIWSRWASRSVIAGRK